MQHNHVMALLGTGGIQYFVTALAKEQRRRGDEVHLWLLDTPSDLASQQIAEQQERGLKAIGVRVHHLNAGNRNIPINARRLRQERSQGKFAKESQQVWHAHCAVAMPVIWLASQKRSIFWLHNTSFEFPKRLTKLLGAFTSTYIASSGSIRDSWSKVLRSGIQVIPYGLEPGVPSSTREYPPRATKFLVIARLEKQKRVDRLLWALRELVSDMGKSGDRLVCTIVGDGSQRAELERLREQLQLETFVQFVGAQSDLEPYLRTSDVFVLSSDFEGTPIAMLQAVAAGLPVLITPFPGGSEFVQRFNCGLVAEGFSSSDLAKTLLRVCTEDHIVATLAKGVSAAASELSVERSVDLLEQLPGMKDVS